jgi:hypothetical protein
MGKELEEFMFPLIEKKNIIISNHKSNVKGGRS